MKQNPNKTNLDKSPEELAREVNQALKNEREMTPEEKCEYDAQFGYFHGDDSD